MNPAVPTKGILAALWLPTDEAGDLITADLAWNIAFLRRCGIHGILALGSTGEFSQLDIEQRKRALALVAELAHPLPVIANISDIRPRAVADLGRFARQLGLPAISIMTPGFYPSSQDDVLAHFLHAAESSGLPTFLYNFPELTGTRIDLDTVRAFADRAPMAGIKHSGLEFAYNRDLVRLGLEKNFVVFSGNDTRLPELFEVGVAGCIGGTRPTAIASVSRVYKGRHTQKHARKIRCNQSCPYTAIPIAIAAAASVTQVSFQPSIPFRPFATSTESATLKPTKVNRVPISTTTTPRYPNCARD